MFRTNKNCQAPPPKKKVLVCFFTYQYLIFSFVVTASFFFFNDFYFFCHSWFTVLSASTVQQGGPVIYFLFLTLPCSIISDQIWFPVLYSSTYQCLRIEVYFTLFYFFCLLSFQGRTHGIWRFPGQGLKRRCSCRPMPQPWQRRILATSVTYTTAHSDARSLTP